MYKSLLKRSIDIVVSFSLLFILLPILISSALLVLATSRGPIFFFQTRTGYKGKTFRLFKFRTMTHRERKEVKEVYKGNSEVTKIGAILRRFKIDELPQLINVLLGDMSLIGPRPSLPEMLNDLNTDGLYRIQVRPGLTGLAQVNGNIYLSWPERWKYDRHYVENLSFWLDVKVVFKTISVVLFGEEKFVKRPVDIKK